MRALIKVIPFIFIFNIVVAEPVSQRSINFAIVNYNKGLEYRNEAWEYIDRADMEKDEEKKQKLTREVNKQFNKALKKFQIAVEKYPDFYQAYSSLGYINRELGNPEIALDAYNQALKINPDYPQAIEGRGEIYLELNRIEEAKSAFIYLCTNYSDDLRFADLLFEAMWSWLENVNIDSTITNETIENLSQWLNEHESMIVRNSS